MSDVLDLFADLVEDEATISRLPRDQPVPDGFVVAYCDGSSLRNPNGPAGWGWWSSDTSYAEGGFILGSNNVGEMQAIIEVLKSVPLDTPLVVISDSKYAIGACWEWALGWEAKGWRKKDKREPENLDMVKEAYALLHARTADTMFKHVRGHNRDARMLKEDVIGNDHADRLATSASSRADKGDVSTQGPGWTPAG